MSSNNNTSTTQSSNLPWDTATTQIRSGASRGRSRRASARSRFLDRMNESGTLTGKRTVTWTATNDYNEYTFQNSAQNDMAWRFVEFIMNCHAYGRSDKATRKNFIASEYPHQIDNPNYAHDFFAAAKDARLVEEASRNSNNEIVYRLGQNFYAFSLGKLSRSI